MGQGYIYTFQDFVLDIDSAVLRERQERRALRPKAFDLLRYFVERPGQLITKEELFNALWPQIVVDNATLTGCIRDLRAVLNDDAKQPRFIETVPTRGYRFIAEVQRPESNLQSQEEENQKSKVKNTFSDFGPRTSDFSASALMGRDAELAALQQWLAKARRGERQVVFVTGEPGIGKTSLVETFLKSLASSVQSLASKRQSPSSFPVRPLDPRPQTLDAHPCIGHGQCVKQYGSGEAYLPVFEALTRLGQGVHSRQLIAVLRQYAPTWLAQMPGFLSPQEFTALQLRVVGTTRERMLREFAEAVEMFTKDQLLVLWFDDLHDSDPSTLDLIAYLARRQQPARLLLVGTYRPAEALSGDRGLPRVQQELRERRQWQELALECLNEPTIEDYLKVQFPGATTFSFPTLARAVYRRTEGNPLFLVSMLDDLKAQQMLVRNEGRWHLQVNLHEVVSRVPATLHGTLAGQLHDLQPEEQEVLEAASVAGMSFAVPLVSVATSKSLLEAEGICESLARRERFICRDGMEEWPDRTLATRYRFRHALHQDVAYQRIPPLKRSQRHQQIGERRERAFASEVGTVAVELAAHFEQSRDYERAVRYLRQASEQALQRSAYHEAISLATKGLSILRLLLIAPDRTQLELRLRMVLAASFATTKGTAVPEVEQTCHRALELCRQADDDPQLFPVLSVLFGFLLVSAQFQTARELAERLLRLAEQQSEPVLKLAAHLALGIVLWQTGELTSARVHFDRRQSLYSPQDHLKFLQFGHCPTVTSLAFAASALWYLGYPDQARRAGLEAMALAERLAHPYTHGVTLNFVSQVFHELREISIVQTQTDRLLALCREQDFREGLAREMITRGWILAQQGQAKEGIVQIREGIAICEAIGTQMDRSRHLAVLAEVYAFNDQPAEGLAVLEEALQQAEKTSGRYYTAEIYRLMGQLTLQKGARGWGLGTGSSSPQAPGLKSHTPREVVEEAEGHFLKAIDVAREQQAKSLELRATVGLARLWQQQRKHHEAHSMLSDIYNWFTEGFDTADLQETRTLLEELCQ